MPNFCQRLLKKEGYKDYKKTILVYTMIWSLEQVADYYNNIFNYLLNSGKRNISKVVLEIYEDVNKLLDSYHNIFYSFDSNKVSNLKEDCLNMIERIRKEIKDKNESNATILLN